MPPDVLTVEVADGRRATYRVFGSGEPLLLFVGGPGLPAIMEWPDAEILKDRFLVYLIDPFGSGGSSPPRDPAEYDHLGHAGFYDEVRGALGLERVSVAGRSFGGIVALTYAATYPAIVDRCIPLCTRATGEELADEAAAEEFERNLSRHSGAEWYPQARTTMDEWTERTLAASEPAELTTMMRQVLPLYLAEPDRPDVRAWLDRLDPFVECDLTAMKTWESGLYQRIDLRLLLPRIRCRTLVVAGALDFICGPEHAKLIATSVAGAALTIIEGCGHDPAIEEPDALRATIAAWLDAG